MLARSLRFTHSSSLLRLQSPGGPVAVVRGPHAGRAGVMEAINTAAFKATIRLDDGLCALEERSRAAATRGRLQSWWLLSSWYCDASDACSAQGTACCGCYAAEVSRKRWEGSGQPSEGTRSRVPV